MGENTNPTMTKIWDEVLAMVKEKYDSKIYHTFFLPTKPLYVDDQYFVVETQTRFAKEILNIKFAHQIN